VTQSKVATPPLAPALKPRLRDVLAGEWSKLASWPAVRWLVGLALVLSALGSAAFVLSTSLTTGRAAAELPQHDRLTVSLLGVDLANVTMIVMAVIAVSSEISTGQVASTLLLAPRRRPVVAAKLLVLVALGSVVSIGSTLLAFGTGQLILRGQGIALPSLTDPGVARLLGGTMALIPVHVALAAVLALCLRSGSVAFAAMFLLMCLPALAGLLPGGLGETVQWVLPGPSLYTLSGAAQPGDADYTAPGAAALTLLVWLAAGWLVSSRVFRRRDF